VTPRFRIPQALALGLALLAPGCASSDVSKDAKVRDEVVLALPTDAPAPEQVSRAIWFPNGSGFGSSDWSPLGHPAGVLVLAGDRLWFMTWNDHEHHYDVQRSIDFIAAARLAVAHLGTASMLVVQAGNNALDAFELMEGGEVGSDPKATQALYERLQDLRARHPAQDP
jgi:hypothetical protein